MRRSFLLFIILVLIGLACSFILTNYSANRKNTNEITNDNKGLTGYDFSSELTGDSWPVNSFTKMIPKPNKGELKIVSMGKSRISYDISNVSESYYKEYISQAKEKGFTVNASSANGYRACNEDEYLIEIFYTSKTSTMSVSVTY